MSSNKRNLYLSTAVFTAITSDYIPAATVLINAMGQHSLYPRASAIIFLRVFKSFM